MHASREITALITDELFIVEKLNKIENTPINEKISFLTYHVNEGRKKPVYKKFLIHNNERECYRGSFEVKKVDENVLIKCENLGNSLKFSLYDKSQNRCIEGKHMSVTEEELLLK